MTDELKRRGALVSLSYAEFVEALCRASTLKPTPLEEDLTRIGVRTARDFAVAMAKLGRHKVWLERAAAALPPYAERCARGAGDTAPIEEELRRLLEVLAQERAREAASALPLG